MIRLFGIGLVALILAGCNESTTQNMDMTNKTVEGDKYQTIIVHSNLHLICFYEVRYLASRTYGGAWVYSPMFNKDSKAVVCE